MLLKCIQMFFLEQIEFEFCLLICKANIYKITQFCSETVAVCHFSQFGSVNSMS